MYDEQVWTNKANDKQSQGRTDLGMNPSDDKRLFYHCANNIWFIDIINEKRKCCNRRCPDSVYFHILLLIIYLSAIETLMCR